MTDPWYKRNVKRYRNENEISLPHTQIYWYGKSKLDEKWQSYDQVKRVRQSGAGLFWAIRWPFWPHFFEMTFKLFLPFIWINIDRQTDL